MTKQLGDILVDAGIITTKTVERALKLSKSQGKRLGQVLGEMGVITEAELMEAINKQGSPFVHLNERKPLGEILVNARIISETTLERALERAKSEGRRLGETLERMGVISEDELAEALGRQLDMKTITSFADREFVPEFLAMLPIEFVVKRSVFPLMQKDNTLAVAIYDPFDGETSELICKYTGLELLPVLAPRREIMKAISRHYLHMEPSSGAGDAILLVEGSSAVAAVIQSALAREGYKVLLANSGLDALNIIVTSYPKLVITEALLSGLDGYGLLKAIKSNPVTERIPVIMLTGNATSFDEQKAFEAGFFDFIPKPVQPVRIISRVKRALDMTKGVF